MITRGNRRTARLDFATATWQRNEWNVDVLELSRDTQTGALTMALRCPPGLVYPEEEHFYDCEEDLFQFDGEFHHDEIDSYREGDYIYRPIGTVYGHGIGSHQGGLTIASLAREMRRFHFQGHPGPWRGHYLVDRLWNPRPVTPFIIGASSLQWHTVRPGVAIRALRGQPGERSALFGASTHSPWAADAVFILRLDAGFDAPFPTWDGFVLELLTLDGRATIAAEEWYRGCYAFDGAYGRCVVGESLQMYVRAFADLSG